jgi:hypothetical protein
MQGGASLAGQLFHQDNIVLGDFVLLAACLDNCVHPSSFRIQEPSLGGANQKAGRVKARIKRGGTIFRRALKSTVNSAKGLRNRAALTASCLYGHLVIGMRDYNIVAGAIITACGGEGFSLVSPRP